MSPPGGVTVDDDDPELKHRLREQALALVRGIPAQRERMAEMERDVVRNARLEGIGWDEIGAALGIAPGTERARIVRDQYGEPEGAAGDG